MSAQQSNSSKKEKIVITCSERVARAIKVEKLIEEMGEKWVLHRNNATKKISSWNIKKGVLK
jgi:hypothetical protein